MKVKMLNDYKVEFEYLEELRKSGVVNMFGATPYLEAEFSLSKTDAREILQMWMHNYEGLANRYGWEY